MEVWDILAVLPLDAMVTIADSDGDFLFAGHKGNVPMDMRELAVERIAPSRNYLRDFEYLWIEVS